MYIAINDACEIWFDPEAEVVAFSEDFYDLVTGPQGFQYFQNLLAPASRSGAATGTFVTFWTKLN